MSCHKIAKCRVCGKSEQSLFLRLGPTPLANSFLKSPDEFEGEKSYPLDVYFCQSCSAVQLLDVVDPEILFRHYIYVTSTSSTIETHNEEYAKTVVDFLNLGSDDLVVEVASNDGSLLKFFKRHKVKVLGVEPATNIASIADQKGIETLNEFFNSATAARVKKEYGPAKVVIGNNVLAHVDNTQDFLNGFKDVLSDDGIAVFEVPYLVEFINRLEYDTVYHEHLSYFSVTSIVRLCEEVDLSVVRIDRVPVHGGSLRIYASKKEQNPSHCDQAIKMIEAEQKAGMNNFDYYKRFAENVQDNRRALLDLLESLKAEGKSIAAYGAPAKGNTLLNYCGIGTDLIPYTVDKNPLKVGQFTPGMHIPVLDVSVLLERQPDYVLILAWNFADEIMHQQKEYHERGGKFIIPIPEPKVI